MISSEQILGGYRVYMGKSILRIYDNQNSMIDHPKESFLMMRNRLVYEMEGNPIEWNYVLDNGFDFEIMFTEHTIVTGYENDKALSSQMFIAHYYVSLTEENAIHYKMFVELPK